MTTGLDKFPAAVPEIPVTDMDQALDYYAHKLGFSIDWGGANGGITGISKGECRMFLTDRNFREQHGNVPPVIVWLNLDSKEEVDELYGIWNAGKQESSHLRSRSRGSCMSSQRLTWMATCSAYFLISPETLNKLL